MSALVSSQGRLFYILDEGSRVSIELPADWQLIARDAFNGTVLWKQPIAKWHDHMWPLKSGPTQLARRLVADGEDLYVTLGIDAPLSRASTQRPARSTRTYEGTKGTEEVILHHGTLLPAGQPGRRRSWTTTPRRLNVGDQGRVAEEFVWNEKPREVMAFDAESGKRLWSHTSKVAPLTLCADDKRVVFHDGEKVVCLDPNERQTALAHRAGVAPQVRSSSTSAPKLVTARTVRAVRRRRTDRCEAFDAADGKMRWDRPRTRAGYQSPQDLLIIGGLVWAAPTTSGRDRGIYTGRDLLTGEVKSRVPARRRHLLVPSPLLHRQGDRPLHHAFAHRDRVRRPQCQALGHQPLGPRRLPVRRAALQRPDSTPRRTTAPAIPRPSSTASTPWPRRRRRPCCPRRFPRKAVWN